MLFDPFEEQFHLPARSTLGESRLDGYGAGSNRRAKTGVAADQELSHQQAASRSAGKRS
jgi:hypothetical protein